ncbi:MAG: hypothetical protein ACJAQ3_003485, partial [Planctomycetota bacterium]
PTALNGGREESRGVRSRGRSESRDGESEYGRQCGDKE